MSVFHEGELALQRQAGTRQRLAEAPPSGIRAILTPRQREFFAGLPYLVVGGMDDSGQVWASLLAGPPGFIQAPREDRLEVRGAVAAEGDPLAGHLRPGASIGLLGLEAQHRQRVRANGRIVAGGAEGFALAIDQAFSNCPKYIHRRRAEFVPSSVTNAEAPGIAADAEARRIIRQADTFFLASAHPEAAQGANPRHGCDASHRAGAPGFVDLSADGILTLPDYPGNGYFNTVGNLLLNPRAGLLFVDFATSRLLWVAAEATIAQTPPDPERHPGAERLLAFTIRECRHAAAPQPLRWTMAADQS